jgi:hypothetical protein
VIKAEEKLKVALVPESYDMKSYRVKTLPDAVNMLLRTVI